MPTAIRRSTPQSCLGGLALLTWIEPSIDFSFVSPLLSQSLRTFSKFKFEGIFEAEEEKYNQNMHVWQNNCVTRILPIRESKFTDYFFLYCEIGLSPFVPATYSRVLWSHWFRDVDDDLWSCRGRTEAAIQMKSGLFYNHQVDWFKLQRGGFRLLQYCKVI